MNRRNLFLSLFVGLAVILGLSVTLSVAAPEGPPIKPITTSFIIPLEGDTSAGGDVVHVSGMVHIVSQVVIGATSTNIKLNINLQGVSGIGNPSGGMYTGTGAFKMNFQPPDPILPPISATFVLQPDGPPQSPPDPVFPLPIVFTLTFSVDTGGLTGASAFVGVP